MATPVAYGSSQARGWIRATALAYTTATATRDLSCVCDLQHSSRKHWIPNPLSKARDWTRILMDTSHDSFPLCHNGNSLKFFKEDDIILYSIKGRLVFTFMSYCVPLIYHNFKDMGLLGCWRARKCYWKDVYSMYTSLQKWQRLLLTKVLFRSPCRVPGGRTRTSDWVE